MTALVDTIKEVGTALSVVDEAKRQVLVKSLIRLIDQMTTKIDTASSIIDHFHEFSPVMDKQLLAVEKRTEKATDEIMEVAEALTADLAGLSGESKEKIQKHVNSLFEISGFQDLVAQHLIEIKMRMGALQKDMEELEDVFSAFTSGSAQNNAKPKTSKTNNKRLDNKLLNGPSTDV